MANTYVDYTAVASQTDYNFSFEYLRDDHVKVKVDDVIVTNYTIVTSPVQLIRFDTAPTASAEIRIYRDSRGDFSPLVDFVDGSVLTENELDEAYRHNLFVSQEASEGTGNELLNKKGGANYDAEGNKIINLGTPTASADAANKAYTDQAIDNAIALGGSPAIVSLGGYDVTSTNATLKQLRAWTADIETGDKSNTTVTATGSTTARSLASRFADVVNVKDYGALGDYHSVNNPTADDTTAIQNAITAATSSAPFKTLYFPEGSYRITTEITFPQFVSGNFDITGDVKWSFNKHIKQSGRLRVFGNITLDSVWYSEFEYLEALNGNVKLESTSSAWGTFWNSFGTIICDLLEFNVDGGQSVNQNSFQNIRASDGLHVKGVNTSGIRECHNNVIYSLDTTGANLTATDTTTGHHILNDSDRNQSNTVVNWYAETSGNRKVTGNWNILGSNVDSNGHFVQVERENHYLFSGGTGRNGDYFAGSPINKARGGSFKQFKRNQIPIGLSAGGGINFQTVSTTDSPDGNPIAVKFTGTVSHAALSFSYPLGSSSQLGFTAFIKTANSPDLSVEVRNASNNFNYPGRTLQNVKNDWYLLRFSIGADYLGSGSGQTNGLIRISLTGNSVPSPNPEVTLGSYFIATEQTVFLPQYEQGVKEIYDTTFPTGGGTIWEVGDVCWNSTPTAGGTPGWICVTAGSPGTWKAMASLAV